MTIFSVNMADLDSAYQAAQREARSILELVNQTQRRLERTNFVGEVATDLEAQMNEKMGTFVTNSYANVNQVLTVMTQNMNVVVTKLGGAPWVRADLTPEAMAQAAAQNNGSDYSIDIDEMDAFANEVDDWFSQIVAGYRNIESAVADGTPGWQGPEKIATVNAVQGAVTTIVSGGEGSVVAVGDSLSGLLRSQVATMQSV